MWRDIKEYEGLYEINENAVVRRVEGKGIDTRACGEMQETGNCIG